MAKMFESIFLWHEAAHGTKVPLTDSRWDIVEPAYDLLPWFSFIVYGIPEEDHEQISEECYEGNFENAQKIGEVCGHLIMGAVIEGTERTLDDVCDENSADLQYVYSALFEDGPFECMEDMNVLYIHELCIDEEYRNAGIGTLILDVLPEITLKHLHVKPDLLAYLPRRIELSSEEAAKIAIIERERTQEELINDLMGKRNTRDVYYLHQRNERLFGFYYKNGFEEAGKSGLLYKPIDFDSVDDPFMDDPDDDDS